MKTLLKIILLLVVVQVAAAATLTNILYLDVTDYGLAAAKKVDVTVTLVDPIPLVVDGRLILCPPVTHKSDTNGRAWFTNYQAALYVVQADGNPATPLPFYVYTNTIGTWSLTALAQLTDTPFPNALTNYYNRANIDALLAALRSTVGGGFTNVSYGTQTNFLASDPPFYIKWIFTNGQPAYGKWTTNKP